MTYDDLMDGRRELLAREEEAERRRVAREASIAFDKASRLTQPPRLKAVPTMYTSEPIPRRQSPFYAGDRYIADAELARRERLELRAQLGGIR